MEEQAGFLMDEPSWGQRIKNVRLKLGITQVGLADRLGTHENTIALWEMREARPYSALAEKFLKLEAEVLEEEEPS